MDGEQRESAEHHEPLKVMTARWPISVHLQLQTLAHDNHRSLNEIVYSLCCYGLQEFREGRLAFNKKERLPRLVSFDELAMA